MIERVYYWVRRDQTGGNDRWSYAMKIAVLLDLVYLSIMYYNLYQLQQQFQHINYVIYSWCSLLVLLMFIKIFYLTSLGRDLCEVFELYGSFIFNNLAILYSSHGRQWIFNQNFQDAKEHYILNYLLHSNSFQELKFKVISVSYALAVHHFNSDTYNEKNLKDVKLWRRLTPDPAIYLGFIEKIYKNKHKFDLKDIRVNTVNDVFDISHNTYWYFFIYNKYFSSSIAGKQTSSQKWKSTMMCLMVDMVCKLTVFIVFPLIIMLHLPFIDTNSFDFIGLLIYFMTICMEIIFLTLTFKYVYPLQYYLGHIAYVLFPRNNGYELYRAKHELVKNKSLIQMSHAVYLAITGVYNDKIKNVILEFISIEFVVQIILLYTVGNGDDLTVFREVMQYEIIDVDEFLVIKRFKPHCTC
eukprot:216769_1